APPRRKECEVRSGVAPAGSATRLSILFTSSSGTPSSSGTATSATRSGNWDRSAAHGASCVASAMARACKGHVKKSLLSGIKVRPCSSDVLTRSSRR
ncbi:hypothetical protein PHYSODRAFT_499163, partial [Phytophthora sojae]